MILRVDIGCGDRKPEGFIGVDVCPGPAVDIVADISKQFPFADDSVDELRAYDVVEHLPDRINTMNEIWRVCKPGAKIDILVPSTDGRGAFQDPTHISFWNINSFGYYCIEFPGYLYLCRKYGFKGAFRLLNLEQRESVDRIIHVKADLEVVKPAPNFVVEHNVLKVNTTSNSSNNKLFTLDTSSTSEKIDLNFPSISALIDEHQRPLWSVMIPVYNPNLAYLEQTLKSVLSQDPGLEKMQITVVDDCSENPDLEAWIQEIGQGRIDFYRRKENLGLLPSWNDCLQRAKGHWVHLLHQDDIVLPGFYARLQSVLTQPDIGAAFCRHFHIDNAGNRYYVSPIEKQTSGILENWSERLATAQRIQFASIVVRRSTYETLGGFCLEAQSAADWEMWQRIAANYPVWYEPEPLACYRLHDRSESSRLHRSGQNIADVRRAIQISAAYLPPEKAVDLVNQALENYALMALSTAEQMLVANDTEAAVAQIREGLKCSQSSSIQTRLMAMLAESAPTQSTDTELAPSLFTDSTNLTDYLERYKTDPLDETAKAYLVQVREQLAQWMLNCSEEQFTVKHQANWLNHYQALLASGIQNEPKSETEHQFIKTLFDRLDSEPNQFLETQSLIVAMLYCRPEQLPWRFNLNTIPEWLVDDYLKFMMTPPALFQQLGDADRYYQFMQCWIDYLHSQITTNPDVPLWQTAAVHFTATANFIPLYFNNENLKEIYIKRSQIMASALTQRGYQLDCEFSERSADQKKIRLGILSAHFSPQSETFASLPSYKHLDRDQFEIILFSLTETQHRLERYCIGHADAFVVLKGDLANQVQTIRQADLDMLLVVTNVTAVSNAVALLTMHRLARIQIINVCSCTSTGMEHADYYISGTLTEPNADQQRHTENLLLVEGPAHCYDLATEEFARPTTAINRSDLGIADDEIVYISGSNFFKILPEVETAWAQILANVPHSKLILYPFNPNWAESYPKFAFKQRLEKTLENYGIAIDRVIVLEPAPSYGDVKERLKLGDVYLDAFPFAGATSLIDPLTLGLPTVVMDGKVFRSRMGAAFLRELEMPELIAPTPEAYISLAVTLGINSDWRNQVQTQILQQIQRCPRFIDSRNHSMQTGTLLQNLFQQHQTTQLQHDYRLRSINLLALPDWNQPEEHLLQNLADLFRQILTRPDRSQITLVLSTNGIDQDEADELVGNVVMHLLTTEELDIGDEEPEISLIHDLSLSQWQSLLPHLSARFSLEYENSEAIESLERAIGISGVAALPLV